MTTSQKIQPRFRLALLISLLLTFVWGVIGFSVGVNAIVQRNRSIAKFKADAPTGSTVFIDTNDVLISGGFITAACALLFVSSAIFAIIVLVFPFHRSHRFAPAILIFSTLLLLASLIPFTIFFATRSAGVTAYEGGVKLPNTLVQAIIKALGLSAKYTTLHYLRLAAILPWITFLCAVVTIFVYHLAGSHLRGTSGTTAFGRTNEDLDRKEKNSAETAEVPQGP